MARSTNNLNSAFGKVLRELRSKADISQQELAFECELDRTYISLLERGLRQPTISTIFILAETLGIKPSKMIRIVEDSME